MKDDISRLREMSEDTLRVLDVAEQMVNSTYQRLCGLLHETEQENDRLRQRISELEMLLGKSETHTNIISRSTEETTAIRPKICSFSSNQELRSSNLADALELK